MTFVFVVCPSFLVPILIPPSPPPFIQVDDGACVTHIGEIGSGNYVKMVHNGIEYGDMQLIAEAYDVLKLAGGLSNEELGAVFEEWNRVSRGLCLRSGTG